MKNITTLFLVLACVCFFASSCSQESSQSNFKSSLAHVKDDSFTTKVLESKTPVLVAFYAVWCGPCKKLAPIIEEIANENVDKLTVVKLNTDNSPKTAQKYQIRGIPTLILFKDGAEVDRVVGLVRKEKIQSLVDKAF